MSLLLFVLFRFGWAMLLLVRRVWMTLRVPMLTVRGLLICLMVCGSMVRVGLILWRILRRGIVMLMFWVAGVLLLVWLIRLYRVRFDVRMIFWLFSVVRLWTGWRGLLFFVFGFWLCRFGWRRLLVSSLLVTGILLVLRLLMLVLRVLRLMKLLLAVLRCTLMILGLMSGMLWCFRVLCMFTARLLVILILV